jgi:hypothetical protein
MVGTPRSPILSGRSSRIAALHGTRCVSLVSLGEAFPRFSSSFSDPGSTSTSSSAFSYSSIGSVGLIFLDVALGLAKLIPNNILKRRFTCVEVLPHTTLLQLSKGKLGLPPSSEALIRTKTIVRVHVLIGYAAIASHMTFLTSGSISL